MPCKILSRLQRHYFTSAKVIQFKEIYLDSNNTLHATVIDTYDFNEGEFDPKIFIPRALQKNGEIIPYYAVIKTEVPEAIWTKY